MRRGRVILCRDNSSRGIRNCFLSGLSFRSRLIRSRLCGIRGIRRRLSSR